MGAIFKRGFRGVIHAPKATRALKLTDGHRYHRDFDVVPGMPACFHDAAHILGAAVGEVRMTHHERETTTVPVFLVHGDPQASAAFQSALADRYAQAARIPAGGDRVDVTAFGRPREGEGAGT